MRAARSDRATLLSRCRRWRLGAVLLAGLAALRPRVGFASPRTSRPRTATALARGPDLSTESRGEVLARIAGRAMVKDPLQGVSPEVQTANNKWAQRLEDIFLTGTRIWANMLKQGTPKKFYFIGTNGNMGDQVAESIMDSLAYVPAPDGTLALQRKPNIEYPVFEYTLWDSDDELSKRSRMAALDVFIENEDEYRDLEAAIIKEFSELEFDGHPHALVVGESALNRQENVDIIKQGIVIWCDATTTTTWKKTQMPLGTGKGGISLKGGGLARPPIWCLAQGWEADPDDGEARVEYERIVEEFRKEYDKISDVRVRVDVPGLRENSYWVAERLLRALSEFLGIVEETSDSSVDDELFARDLEKFLEGARLSKYFDTAKEWCEKQGANALEDLAESVPELGDALELKPLEKKRLEKAAQVLAVAA